jgi:hypothetical protein
MQHPDFIANIAKIYNPKVYVELGLYQGETLSKVQPYIEKGYGIDMTPNDYLENLKQYSNLEIKYTTTNTFFETFNDGIDMAFIDADHCYESVVVDFENVYKRLNPGGIIILHDTDPISDHLIQPIYCGDSYKIVKYLENKKDINCITLPISDPGLTIVSKKNDTRTLRRGTNA